jgi:hypothetical protein
MNNNKNINRLVEDALESFDDAKRAEPKPYLLTRIHATMNKGKESLWEKTSWFIARPAVAFTGLCIILLVNAVVIISNKSTDSTTVAEQTVQTQGDEFSYTVATIYDTDNTQPNDK